jgi:hypothetical protein
MNPSPDDRWPEDVAEVYQDIVAEDRRLAEDLWPIVVETWPADDERLTDEHPR